MICNELIYVLDIIEGTSVDGTGLRTSIYFAGCEHRCKGCHNPESWAVGNGRRMSVDELFRTVAEADMNVTFSGGDPMFRPEAATMLARRIKTETDKTIWCYTGYTFEEIMRHPHRRALLETVDVLVDGQFVLSERDTSLRFRGSRNQRIIDVARSLAAGCIVELDEESM